jgi:hypothetical protein
LTVLNDLVDVVELHFDDFTAAVEEVIRAGWVEPESGDDGLGHKSPLGTSSL